MTDLYIADELRLLEEIKHLQITLRDEEHAVDMPLSVALWLAPWLDR